jgi:hypothetical protein
MGVNQNEENRYILTHNQVVVGSNPTGPTIFFSFILELIPSNYLSAKYYQK